MSYQEQQSPFEVNLLSRIAGWKIAVLGVWFLFTVALTVWWYIFSNRQLEAMKLLGDAAADQLIRNQRMLLWEGGALVTSIVIGAAAILYFMYREVQETRRVRDFFLTFSHELKTPLSAVRLNVESLLEDISEEHKLTESAESLQEDVNRLALRLENALFIATLGDYAPLEESLSLREVLRSMEASWPQMQISINDDCSLQVDRRVLESILGNIIQNAKAHGQASKIDVNTRPIGNQSVELLFKDDGVGIQGQRDNLGKPLSRLYSGSGTGMGLYLCKKLAGLARGNLKFEFPEKGFVVRLELPGSIA